MKYKWTGKPIQPLAYSLKKNAKAVCKTYHHKIIQIEFNFNTVYCILIGNKLLMPDESQTEIAFVSNDFGHLIGRNDPYQLGSGDKLDSFRNALTDRLRDEFS